MFYRLLHLNLMLHREKSNPYVQSMFVYGCLMEYNKRMGLPVHEMRTKSLSMFNEESGEQSFSILARCALGDTNKAKLSTMSGYYSSIHTQREIDDELRQQRERAETKIQGSWRKKYSADDEEVLEYKSFLRTLIREKKKGISKVINLATDLSHNSLMAANNATLFSRAHSFWISYDKTLFYFNRQAEKCTKFFGTNFGMLQERVWPEMVHPESDSEAEAQEQQAQAQARAAQKEKVLPEEESDGNNSQDSAGRSRNHHIRSSSEESEGSSSSSSDDDNDLEEAEEPKTPAKSKKFGAKNNEINQENVLSVDGRGNRKKRRR